MEKNELKSVKICENLWIKISGKTLLSTDLHRFTQKKTGIEICENLRKSVDKNIRENVVHGFSGI
jgi:hypothetical protein